MEMWYTLVLRFVGIMTVICTENIYFFCLFLIVFFLAHIRGGLFLIDNCIWNVYKNHNLIQFYLNFVFVFTFFIEKRIREQYLTKDQSHYWLFEFLVVFPFVFFFFLCFFVCFFALCTIKSYNFCNYCSEQLILCISLRVVQLNWSATPFYHVETTRKLLKITTHTKKHE